MLICSYCQQDSAGNHAWDCPMNPININNNLISQPKPNYYHVSWLEVALENFKNQYDVVHTVKGNTTMKEFIKRWAKDELSKVVDIS